MISFLDELKAYFQRAPIFKGVYIDHSCDTDELITVNAKFPFINILGNTKGYEDILKFNWDEGSRITYNITIFHVVRSDSKKTAITDLWTLSENTWTTIKAYIAEKYPAVRLSKKPTISTLEWKMKGDKWIMANVMNIEFLSDNFNN